MGDIRAVSASYCDGKITISYNDGSVISFLGTDIKPHQVDGNPDIAAVKVIDGGHSISFGENYEVNALGLRYNFDPEFKAAEKEAGREYYDH